MHPSSLFLPSPLNMKTTSFEHLINNKNYKRPHMSKQGNTITYEPFTITKIKELNVCDSINNHRIKGPINRGYQIFWSTPNTKEKYFVCGLGSDTFKRFVIPNLNLIEKP